MPRVLVVEDNPKVLRGLERGLQAEGYEVVTASDGDEGYRLAAEGPFDCVVLDLLLPGRDGLRVLADLRRAGRSVPVLVLTARDAVEDRVTGLDAGADDYLVKPFALTELLARLRALLRRGQADRETPASAGSPARAEDGTDRLGRHPAPQWCVPPAPPGCLQTPAFSPSPRGVLARGRCGRSRLAELRCARCGLPEHVTVTGERLRRERSPPRRRRLPTCRTIPE